MNPKKLKILGIIPARGGSKGIPHKNMAKLNGKPLIAYTIETGLKSKYIDKLVVSTEDKKIAETSKKYGAEVVKRPHSLARDSSPTIPVIKHAVKEVEKKNYHPDLVMILQPTSPLRTTEDVDRSVEAFLKGNSDSLVSVCRAEKSPYWMYNIIKGKIYPIINSGKVYNRRQNLPKAYRLNGAIYITKRKVLDEKPENDIFEKNTSAFVMPQERSIDIDTPLDIKLAETMMSGGTNKIMISKRLIGEGEPCFIIAEAGVNHNGDVKLAKKLVDAAKEAGADAVKFQTFKAEKVVTKKADMAEYQKENIGRKETQFDMLKRLELKEEDFFKLKKYCEKKNIMFLSTPHSNEWSVDLLEKIGVEAYKIGSGDITNIPFLEYVAKTKKPMIVSTGMSTMEEVKEAVSAIKNTGNDKIVILHCTSDYPCNIKDVNLNAMKNMRKEMGVLVGYSDHTEGIMVPIASVALGAVLLEKHFTLDRSMEGPDHNASIEANELKTMIEEIRRIEKALGNKEKRPTKKEMEIAKIARKSIVAADDIPKGVIITKKMIDIKRPGDGIQPKHFKKILGKKTKRFIKKDEIIKWDMI